VYGYDEYSLINKTHYRWIYKLGPIIVAGITFRLYNGTSYRSKNKEFYVVMAKISPYKNGMATAADRMSVASFGFYGWNHFDGYDGAVHLMEDRRIRFTLLLAPT
jgi:Na+(H+)/acetate symporter ActP